MKQQPPGTEAPTYWRMNLERHPRNEGQFQSWWRIATVSVREDGLPTHIINALSVQIIAPKPMTITLHDALEFQGQIHCEGKLIQHAFNKQLEAHEFARITLTVESTGSAKSSKPKPERKSI